MSDLGDFTEFDEAGGEADDSDSGSESIDNTEDDFETYDVSPAGGDRGIGVLSAANGLRIHEDANETRLQAYVTASNRGDVRIGTYLIAPYPDGELLFARVAGLEYAQEFRADDATEIHARRAMRAQSIDEADFKLMTELEPVAILYDHGSELRRRMPDRVPKPETIVRHSDDSAEITTGLKIPDEGVFLGHLAVGGEKVRTVAEPPTIAYRLRDDYERADPLIFRHTLVAGGTGSGKTHFAKNILRQYLSDDVAYPVAAGEARTVSPAVVQFDPQDEYAQMHDDGDYPDEFVRKCEQKGIAYGGHDDTVAFIPQIAGATYAADHHGAEQVPFTIPFEMVRNEPWLMAGSALNNNQYNALENELLPRFEREFGENATYDRFVEFFDDHALREELDESGRVHESTFNAVGRRVRGFSHVFDQDAKPITERIHEFVRPGGLTVVPTYHINDTRATETVVLALASLLVDEKLSNDPEFERIKSTPLIVGMDEAHNFLTNAESVQANHVVGKFTDAAKQGRKERLGLFLITQDPQDIAEPIFKQINTTAVLNLGDEDAISAVNIPSKLESKVPYMEQGQLVIYSPDNSEPVELIGLEHCLTRHGRE